MLILFLVCVFIDTDSNATTVIHITLQLQYNIIPSNISEKCLHKTNLEKWIHHIFWIYFT